MCCSSLTRFLQQSEDAARRLVGHGSLSLHLVFPRCVPGGDLVLGLDQDQAGLVHDFKDLLSLPFIELLPNV